MFLFIICSLIDSLLLLHSVPLLLYIYEKNCKMFIVLRQEWQCGQRPLIPVVQELREFKIYL